MADQTNIPATVAFFALAVALAVIFRLTLRIARLTAERDAAAARTREEFARDMHDLVGHWLWLASIRSETAYRRAAGDPYVSEELGEALQALRHAAHAVRNASRGVLQPLLDGEALRAEQLLASLDVDCVTRVDATGLPAPLSAALGAVVREGVTNLLRHSSAGKCMIETTCREGRIRLTVANDGVPGPGGPRAPGTGRPPATGPDPSGRARAAAPAPPGGLENLRQRMAAVGGAAWTAVDEDGWFRLVAEAPLDRPA
ncbi:sensor histidine kinase [Planomonospora venezuelensis]|uniref:Two-component system sensor histidine kinase DesK n=1 Tax=Planomonospora venezuelensis TaxID=1999 RepID=A0A841D4Y6_PLAVE|nr:histidine kinase [Planomonospora venezuelensis]MBB5964920.1 two-component system sensor histidine kinase DesK [Planomonospora venezuelensis]GIM99508.1 hypothetical protein Pve01_11670 [Planomonospora venezuelensis]